MLGIYPVPPFSPIKHAFDSLSALTAISDVHSTHSLVSRIHTLLSTFLSTSYTVTFIWVPSHRGIPSNEKVDAATKAATSLSRINSQILLTKPIFSSSFTVILQITGSLSGKTKHLPTNWCKSNHYPSHSSHPNKHFADRKFASHVSALATLVLRTLISSLNYLPSRANIAILTHCSRSVMFKYPSLLSLRLTHRVPSSITIAFSNDQHPLVPPSHQFPISYQTVPPSS